MSKIKRARANREISMMLPGNRANREMGERGSADGVRLATGTGARTTVTREDDGDSRGVGRSKTAATSRPGGVARASSSIVREG